MKKIYFSLIILLAVASGYLGYQLKGTKQQNQDLTTEIYNIKNEVENLESELKSKEEEINILNESLSQVQHFDDLPYYSSSSSRIAYTGNAIKTNINGTFNGWSGETIFKMMDGSIWQQAEYSYLYHYAYSPDVLIYSKNGVTYMSVEGVDDEIRIRRIY